MNNRQPKPIGLSKSNDFYDSVGVGASTTRANPANRTNRSVEIKGVPLNQSLPQWGKGDHEVVDEVFLTVIRLQSVCRKCYNEWNGSSGTSTPTKIKEYAEENPQTAVGEGLAPPEKTTANRNQSSIDDYGEYLNPCRDRRPRRSK